ncbi:unannotated protein [freshwater metagenome]|uniref:Unannotated protein n=1 Tax=freshwater metagenome TaxID=449393 RepID=A0A6J7HUJ4_9ZZZZ
MFEEAHVFWVQTKIDIPIPARLHPVFLPLFVGSWLDEEFHFHLLEFARTENEVAWRNFVAEALSGLANAKWWLLASCIHHI